MVSLFVIIGMVAVAIFFIRNAFSSTFSEVRELEDKMYLEKLKEIEERAKKKEIEFKTARRIAKTIWENFGVYAGIRLVWNDVFVVVICDDDNEDFITAVVNKFWNEHDFGKIGLIFEVRGKNEAHT